MNSYFFFGRLSLSYLFFVLATFYRKSSAFMPVFYID
nr:MAG TPA: hypothetical protein [Caudoviricetes sp.]